METDKYIEVADEHFVTSKQTGEVKMKMHDNIWKHFIATLYNVLLVVKTKENLYASITVFLGLEKVRNT